MFHKYHNEDHDDHVNPRSYLPDKDSGCNEPLYINRALNLEEAVQIQMPEEFDGIEPDCLFWFDDDETEEITSEQDDVDEELKNIIHFDEPLEEGTEAWFWMKLWEGARLDALDEWKRLDRQKRNVAFLLSERLRIASEEEKQQIADLLGWSADKTKIAINQVQSIVVGAVYPGGRPH